MLSACANPIIYGFLNENFHREFIDIFNHVRKGVEFIVCYKALRTSSTENSSALNNGDVANAATINHRHKDVSLTMKYHLFRCCRKRKPRSIECHEDEDEDDAAGNNNNIPLRQLNHNQPSVASCNVALDATPTIKLNGRRNADEESCQLLSQNERENHDEDIVSLKDNAISQECTQDNCEDGVVTQKKDDEDTVELISDRNSHKISVLITPSPCINEV